jgi:Ca2+-binding RTX toxin-like protein
VRVTLNNTADDGQAGEGDNVRSTVENAVGGSGNDRFEAQVDPLFGPKTNNLFSGGAGNDYMDGGSGNDILLGDNGADQIFGALGDDTLAGPADGQVDQLDGGLGHDTFIAGPEDIINPGLDGDLFTMTQNKLLELIAALLAALQSIPGLLLGG